MSPKVNTELKIPDLWFDIYARFLPGAGFIAALYYMAGGTRNITTLEVIMLIFVGYLAALVIQPISSEITSKLHDYVAKHNHLHRLYVRVITKKHDPKRILSKMHGETTFFAQASLLSLILFILQVLPVFWLSYGNIPPLMTLAASIWLFFCAFMVAGRRLKRAIDIENAAKFPFSILNNED